MGIVDNGLDGIEDRGHAKSEVDEEDDSVEDKCHVPIQETEGLDWRVDGLIPCQALSEDPVESQGRQNERDERGTECSHERVDGAIERQHHSQQVD